jgi:hypothetical protein
MAAPYYIYGGNLLNREKFTSVVNTAFGQRRYFSSIDTDVYFGDVHIDEMVAFDFIIEEKKIPIFGYNNFTPKRLLTGQKSIQGSFAINFTQTFNLKYIIDGLADSIYANEYEETQFYCADDNKALFGKGFDITLSYGDAKGEGSYNACTQTLVGCYITSYRQAFDTSGEPILDMYTFIAKDLLVISDGSSDIGVEDDDPYTDNDTELEAKISDRYFMGNELDEEEVGRAAKDYQLDNEKLCISIRPVYTFVNGASKLTMRIDVHNKIDLKIDSLKLWITDSVLNLGSFEYNLTKDQSEYNYSYTMLGTQVTSGKNIKKFFEDDDGEYLECHIELKCSANGESRTIEKDTKLYDKKRLLSSPTDDIQIVDSLDNSNSKK